MDWLWERFSNATTNEWNNRLTNHTNDDYYVRIKSNDGVVYGKWKQPPPSLVSLEEVMDGWNTHRNNNDDDNNIDGPINTRIVELPNVGRYDHSYACGIAKTIAAVSREVGSPTLSSRPKVTTKSITESTVQQKDDE